jgi:pyridoxamine 5'-phosphate oxidase
MLQDMPVSHADDDATAAHTDPPPPPGLYDTPPPQAALDPAAMRARYRAAGLAETELAPDPYEQFARWFAAASASGMHEPNAMIVSTAAADGRPSSRTVLLKQYDERGFVFFTNYGSRKGRELEENPFASLLFPWHPIARQVIVSGTAERIGRDASAAYFRTRPHGSQLGAWASEQSSRVASREELDGLYEELAARYPEGEDVPVPPQWGGIRVRPETVEFWQGRENRLHDRLRYVRKEAATGAAEAEAAAAGAGTGVAAGEAAGEAAAAAGGGRSGTLRTSAGWVVERLCP